MSLPGNAWRSAECLCECIRTVYYEFRRRAEAAGIRIRLVETMRDEERQKFYVASKVSKTMNSMHLPQPPNGMSLAFDVCPEEYLYMKGWCPGGDHWRTLGVIGAELGLFWGGEWRGWKDKPHFYYRRCRCE